MITNNKSIRHLIGNKNLKIITEFTYQRQIIINKLLNTTHIQLAKSWKTVYQQDRNITWLWATVLLRFLWIFDTRLYFMWKVPKKGHGLSRLACDCIGRYLAWVRIVLFYCMNIDCIHINHRKSYNDHVFKQS